MLLEVLIVRRTPLEKNKTKRLPEKPDSLISKKQPSNNVALNCTYWTLY